MQRTAKFFNGETELKTGWAELKSEIAAKFPGIKAKSTDSFHAWVGTVDGKYGKHWMPVTRVILYNTRGTKHVCDARCRCAKGGNCECSCGGKFHGIDA